MAITTLNTTKTILGISGTAQDTRITALIPFVEADYLRIRNKAFDLNETATVYPTGAELTAIKMIGFQLYNINQAGKTKMDRVRCKTNPHRPPKPVCNSWR